MRILNRSLVAATALGVGLVFAMPGFAQVAEPTPAEQLARPDMTEDMQAVSAMSRADS